MNQQIKSRELLEPGYWRDVKDVPVQWIIKPERRDLGVFLRSHGFHMIDRTVRATIPLKKSSDFGGFCRIPIESMEKPTDRIYEIAMHSFLLDSRFYGCASATEEDICRAIHSFVSHMSTFSVCSCRGDIAGFIEVAEDRDYPEKQAFIRLAAVDEAYRVAGAALSLYAGAAELCRRRGLQRLWGRISSRNTAVMNLYAALGASFSLPQDVYVKG